MTMIPKADALVEQVYDTIFQVCPPEDREAVARICLLAAQYRIQQLARQRTQRAIDRVAAERKASTRASGNDRSAGAGGVMLSPARAGQEEAQ